MTKQQLSKIIKRIKLLEQEIQIVKKDKNFNINKFIENEYSILIVNNYSVKRIEEFSDLDVRSLPDEIRENEELMCFIWHFINIENEYKLKAIDEKIEYEIGLKKVRFPHTDKTKDIEIIEDHIMLEDLFITLSKNISEVKINTKQIDFINKKDFTKKQIEVIKLFLTGMKQVEISKKLKVDKSAVTKTIQRYKKRLENKYSNIFNTKNGNFFLISEG